MPRLTVFERHRLMPFDGPAAHPTDSAMPTAHTVADDSAYVLSRDQVQQVLRKAGQRALGHGVPGMAAMAVQVMTLMPLRTTVNYQYRYGLGTSAVMRKLWRQGGARRFYQGVGFALIQGPLARFGDTAANAGMLALLDECDRTCRLPLVVKTAAGSVAAAGWRMLLMPLDTAKTMMQVEGSKGLHNLAAKFHTHGLRVLYHGAFASAAATAAGHFPWFLTYNYLDANLSKPHDLALRLARSAAIGFAASVAADTVSNGLRVIKTSKQTAVQVTTYSQIVKEIVTQTGVQGLLMRGLSTRIVANGVQNMLFTVLWQLGQDAWRRRHLST